MLSRQHAILLIVFLIVATIASYINRTPTGDDAWFAEQSFWMLEDGVIRSEFFRGLNNWETELLVSHKLFLWFGTALIYFFGADLPVVQFTGLIPFVIIIAQLTYYLRYRGEQNYGPMMLALWFLIFANRQLVKMSFQNRPEMLLAALGFGAFLLLSTGKNNRELKIIGAGVLSGLAVVAHLNGIIYLVAGFVMLAWSKDFRKAILFGIAGVVTSLLYLIDIIDTPNGFAIWLFQFKNDPAAGLGIQSTKKIIQLATYPRLFFHSPEQIALSALLVFVIWHQWKYLKLLPQNLKVYSLTLFFSFWIITKGNSPQYMVLFIPFMLILLYELYRIRPFVTKPLKFMLLAYLIIGTFGIGQLIHKNIRYGDLPEDYEALRQHIPDKERGLVPLTFFFNEYEEYGQLLTHENYKSHFAKQTHSPDQMAIWSESRDVDFIIYDYKYLSEGYYPPAGQKRIPHYTLAFYDGRFAIYQQK